LEHGDFVVHIVDPDQAITDGLATLLDTYGIRVVSYPDAEAFLETWPQRDAGRCCLLCEADLPGLSGPALLQELCDECVDLPVLLLVNRYSHDLLESARSEGRVGIVEKPFVNDTLINTLLRLRGAA
jgi:FixJ family two-component response regulator